MKGEYIFILDKSGSMCGERVETMKKSINYLLDKLPQETSYIQVIPFDT
jgi:uncharacterized protein YegL